MRERQPEYPPEYDDVPECVGCGDEYVIDAEGTNETPSIEGNCCSWECYAISLKVDLYQARQEIRNLKSEDRAASKLIEDHLRTIRRLQCHVDNEGEREVE